MLPFIKNVNPLCAVGKVGGPAHSGEGMARVSEGLARPQGWLCSGPVTGRSRGDRGQGEGEG